jgi:hypothetical protein
MAFTKYKCMADLRVDDNVTVEDITDVDIDLQKIYLERDRVSMVATAATQMFFLFLLVGLIGVLKQFFTVQDFSLLLFIGITILLIATQPYIKSLKKEEHFLESIRSKLVKSKKKATINRHTIKRR